MTKIPYVRLVPTRDFAIDTTCGEYKGMVDCPFDGATFCIFCETQCPDCGRWVDFSS